MIVSHLSVEEDRLFDLRRLIDYSLYACLKSGMFFAAASSISRIP
jgi:hypothetical protein